MTFEAYRPLTARSNADPNPLTPNAINAVESGRLEGRITLTLHT